MVHSAITLRRSHDRTCEAQQPYWSLHHGEFPWCLDNSEQTDASSDLIGCFDLILADPPRIKRLNGTRMRTPLDRCQPDTSWVQYAEFFLRDQGSLIILTPLESIGAYVTALVNAGLDYRTAYIWNNPTTSSAEEKDPCPGIEAILWAAKETPRFNPSLSVTNLIVPGIDEAKQRVIELLIASFTEPEMNVLEPFTTDITVLAACQKLRRYCLGIARKRSHIKQVKYLLSTALKQTA
jgi:hypothetical protein